MLPKSADDFVRLIGLRPTLALIAEMGGLDIRFPVSEKSSVVGNISAIVGDKHGKTLRSYFGGGEVYLPKAHGAMIALRNLRIIADFEKLIQDVCCREARQVIARQYGLTARTIKEVVNKWAPTKLDQRFR